MSRYFGQSVLTVLRRMTGVWMTCVLVADVSEANYVELVADPGEAMLDDVFSSGEGARCC